MLIAGVDDAGRGPMIGPLIIAGVVMPLEDLKELESIGVKDSKVLAPSKRERLSEEIKKMAARYCIESVTPPEIDRVVFEALKYHKLNRLEADVMARVIANLKPDVAYVDASDVLEDRFREYIQEKLPDPVHIISEHKADQKYPVVSAASILAKVERDRAVAKLRDEYGDLGSGYPADPKTVAFLKKWMEHSDSCPDFVRKSWKPVRKLLEMHNYRQKALV